MLLSGVSEHSVSTKVTLKSLLEGHSVPVVCVMAGREGLHFAAETVLQLVVIVDPLRHLMGPHVEKQVGKTLEVLQTPTACWSVIIKLGTIRKVSEFISFETLSIMHSVTFCFTVPF